MLKATLIGNLGSDPDLRYSASGSPLLRFNVAANHRTRTLEGEYQDRTEWVRVTVTGNRAESLSQYLRKGARVYVSGRLEARPWTDRAGSIQAGIEVLADEVEFFNTRAGDDDDRAILAGPAGERRSPVGAAAGQGTGADDVDLEGLPF